MRCHPRLILGSNYLPIRLLFVKRMLSIMSSARNPLLLPNFLSIISEATTFKATHKFYLIIRIAKSVKNTTTVLKIGMGMQIDT